MDLIAIAKNPVPAGAVSGTVTTPDGIKLRFARWEAARSPQRGTVCVFPGRTEFIEKYFEVVADLRRRGFAVAVLDWRGQGGSDRLLDNPGKGHIRSFRQFDIDLATFMREVVLPNCPAPYVALAHSMGGHILLRNAVDEKSWFSRMVLCAPMIDISPVQLKASHAVVRAVAETACFFRCGGLFAGRGRSLPLDFAPFEDNELTGDRERYQRTALVLEAAPQLALGASTYGWVRAALRSIAQLRAPDFARRIQVPLLLVAAGRDTIVSTQAIEEFAQRLKVGTHVLIPDAKHEILQETDANRQRFWVAFDAYLGIDQATAA